MTDIVATLGLTIRAVDLDPASGELNFVRSSWIKSNTRTVDTRLVDHRTYSAMQWEVVMGLLERQRVRCVVAAGRDPLTMPDGTQRPQLLGWACGEPGAGAVQAEGRGERGSLGERGHGAATSAADPGAALIARPLMHYAYVKRAFRNGGLARALVAAVLEGGPRSDVTATHLPTEGLRRRLEASGWTFRPQWAHLIAADERLRDGRAA